MLSSSLLSLTACQPSKSKNKKYHGYVETDLQYISSANSGRILSIQSNPGTFVKQGESLFTLEKQPLSNQLRIAEAELEQRKATLNNLEKGKRPEEINAIEADILAAQASFEFAQKELKRHRPLVVKGAIPKEIFDKIQQDYSIAKSQLAKLKANLATAQLAARDDVVSAAEAAVSAAQAKFERAQWQADQNTITAPFDAMIFDSYYYIGERLPANQPALSLLTADNLYAIFFIPEAQLATIKLNQKINLDCDNCQTTTAAHIRFISPVAEFTPPVIYSRTSREKLVYRVEASIPAKTTSLLKPGQPIDISIHG